MSRDDRHTLTPELRNILRFVARNSVYCFYGHIFETAGASISFLYQAAAAGSLGREFPPSLLSSTELTFAPFFFVLIL